MLSFQAFLKESDSDFARSIAAFGFKTRSGWRSGVQNFTRLNAEEEPVASIEVEDGHKWSYACWEPGKSGVTNSKRGEGLASLQQFLLSLTEAAGCTAHMPGIAFHNAENRCRHCGKGLSVCPRCDDDDDSNYCPQCKGTGWVPAKSLNQPAVARQ